MVHQENTVKYNKVHHLPVVLTGAHSLKSDNWANAWWHFMVIYGDIFYTCISRHMVIFRNKSLSFIMICQIMKWIHLIQRGKRQLSHAVYLNKGSFGLESSGFRALFARWIRNCFWFVVAIHGAIAVQFNICHLNTAIHTSYLWNWWRYNIMWKSRCREDKTVLRVHVLLLIRGLSRIDFPS